MKRRQLLLGATSVVGAGGLLGTGAFTSVQADRNVAVEVADDSDALLQLVPADGPNGEYATTGGGTLGVDLSGSNPTDAGGSGVNRQAETTIERVFAIENQGTQPVDVTLDPFILQADSGDFMQIYPESEPSPTDGGGDSSIYPVTLDVGDREHFDLFVSVYLGGDAIDGTITVEAEASST